PLRRTASKSASTRSCSAARAPARGPRPRPPEDPRRARAPRASPLARSASVERRASRSRAPSSSRSRMTLEQESFRFLQTLTPPPPRKRATMLTVGAHLPRFQLQAVTSLEKGSEFETLTEKSYPGKWLVLFLWPMDFTFVCPTEIA